MFTKSAQYPFIAWLPAAIDAPTPISALVHSSTLVTAGLYILIRFNKIFLRGIISNIVLLFSFLTLFLSSFIAFLEKDLKKLIAFSTISQVRFIIFSIILGCKILSVALLFIHALFKSLLFVLFGELIILRNFNQLKVSINNKIFLIGFVEMFFVVLTLCGFPVVGLICFKEFYIFLVLSGVNID